MIITVRNTYTFVSKHFNALPEPLQNKIVKQLSYKKKKFLTFTEVPLFLKAFKTTFERYYQFPTGLLSIFYKNLRENNVTIQFIDQRGKKPPQVPIVEFYKHLKKVNPDLEERNYQKNALELCLKQNRGIVVHSTRGGKTIIIAGIVYCANVKTLILCQGIEHINQLSREIRQYTGRVVTVISGEGYNDRGNVVVANVQALQAIKRRNKIKFVTLMEKFKCVMHDEVHHFSGHTTKVIIKGDTKIYKTVISTFKECVYYCTNAFYRFGFTGTFHREDGAALEAIGGIGPVLDRIDYTYLTKNEYIVKARFLFMDALCEEIYGVDEEGNDLDSWPYCLAPGIIHNDKRNDLIRDVCYTYKKKQMQVLVITPLRVKHGKILKDLIDGSRYAYGESDRFYRREILEDFKNKKFFIIISSTIYDEIITLPDVRCVILAGGGKAHNATYQRIGRGIGKAEGKKQVDIIVFWDSHSKVLLNHSRTIKRLIEKEPAWKDNIHFIGKYRKQYSG